MNSVTIEALFASFCAGILAGGVISVGYLVFVNRWLDR